jgi:hypothetical protein
VPGRLTAAVVLTVGIGSVEAQIPPLEAILDRLSAYLRDYETKVFELAAEEQYDQWIKRRPGYGGATVHRRKLRSTYFLVRLPNGQAWYGFRDVASVDGRPVPARGSSMTQLLSQRTVDAYAEAQAMTRENAKYNIGDVFRTINIPLQTLELLLPEHRQRFEFHAGGRERVRGREAAVVGFTERSLPSFISDGFGGDLPAHGRVWVEPVTGAVLRTELGVSGPAAVYLKEMQVRVDYQRDNRLQMFVPSEMEEIYGLDIEVVHGRASYRNYRRFETAGRLVTPPE